VPANISRPLAFLIFNFFIDILVLQPLLPASNDGNSAIVVRLANALDFIHHPAWYDRSSSDELELNAESVLAASRVLDGLPVMPYSPLDHKPPVGTAAGLTQMAPVATPWKTGKHPQAEHRYVTTRLNQSHFLNVFWLFSTAVPANCYCKFLLPRRFKLILIHSFAGMSQSETLQELP
jgi:hypothetical protein